MDAIESAMTMDAATMRQAVEELMAAKQAHDIEALLRLYHPEIELEQSSLGFSSKGHDAVRPGLEAWAVAFPDYEREFEGFHAEGDVLWSWGTARATLTGEFSGHRANGRRSSVMTFVEFTFRDGLIVRERHFWDLVKVCHTSGIPVEAVKPLDG